MTEWTRTPGCGTPCPTCEPQTPLRNHYFFGKLMDVPDFEVEQAYVVEKWRRHHARLHGTGVVCGLEVGAHSSQACQERYLVVGPGSALDCCGNEILVLDPETLDLTAYPDIAALMANPDGIDHRLAVCIRYRECPTEEVPVLYDACGCEDGRCAPNRILETYCLEVQLDPDLPARPPTEPLAPSLERLGTVVLADPRALALHPDTDRVYLAADLGGGTNGLVQQYRLSTQAFLSSHGTATRVLDLDINADGSRLAVALAGAAAADPTRVALLDTATPAAFAGAELATLDLAGSDAPTAARLLPRGAADLAALVVRSGDSRVYRLTIAGASLTAQDDLAVPGLATVAWGLGSDGNRLYLAPASGAVQALDLGAATLAATSPGLAVSGLTALALVKSTAPDRIAWTQSAAGTNRLHLALPDGTDPRQVDLPAPPVALAVDTAGHFAYVLMQPATGDAQVVALDLHRLLAGATPSLSDPLAVGPSGLALTLLGDRLWALFAGGAAVIAIDQTRCGDYLDPHDCPDCATPDCLILATVAGYRPGRRLEDPTDPPSDPGADAAAGIARIDSRTWRRTVPSVADLALALRCLIENCCTGGGGGEQGPPGAPGPGIEAVTVATLPCGQAAQADIAEVGGVRTLELKIPRGCDGASGVGTKGDKGDKGDPGLDWDLPHICDINWVHGGAMAFGDIAETGLIVTFDTPVRAKDLHSRSIQLLVQRPDPRLGPVLGCWCELDIGKSITPGSVKDDCQARTEFQALGAGQDMATAVRITVGNLGTVMENGNLVLILVQLVIDGDFILGKHRTLGTLAALDADHIPKSDPPGSDPDWLSPGDGRASGDGIAGGTFRSWLRVDRG